MAKCLYCSIVDVPFDGAICDECGEEMVRWIFADVQAIDIAAQEWQEDNAFNIYR